VSIRKDVAICVVLFTLTGAAVQASSLSTLAASMQPGTWAQLTTNGFNAGDVLRPANCTGSSLEYMDRGSWNPVNKTVMILGASHPNGTCSGSSNVFASYSDASNSWSNALPNPSPTFDNAFGSSIGHGYNHSTVDTTIGDFYHRQYFSGKVMQFSQAGQAWSQCSQYNSGGAYQVAGALEYFPDRHSLVMLDGGWGVWELDITGGNCTRTWAQRASTKGGGFSPQLTGLSSYHNVSHYSALCHCIVMGGDGTAFYKYDVNGNFTPIATASGEIGIPQGTSGSVFTVDPASGKFLAWIGSGTGYQYDPQTDTWSATGISAPVFPGPEGLVTETVAIPIPDYGVVMFVQSSSSAGGRASVYLYKHAAGGTPPSPPPPPPPTGGSDFQTRCSASGVILCDGFDSPGDLGSCNPATTCYGSWRGMLLAGDGVTLPQIDTTVSASGGGSMKFTIPPNSGANAGGSFFTNFSQDFSVQFGQNSQFYVQWRQRFSPEIINTVYAGGGGWKQADLSTGDKPGCTPSTSSSGLCYGSCTNIEMVTQNVNHREFPQMYQSCSGSASHGPYDPFETPFSTAWNSSNFKLQNAMPSPYCLYDNQGQSKFPPTGNCFGYFPNEWMTFQEHVQIGPWVNGEFTNSHIQLWVAREGQPSQLVIDWGPYNLSADVSATAQQYGKIWLLPYNTSKDSTVTNPVAYTWYDELIVSRNKIADPGGTPPPPPSSTPCDVNGDSATNVADVQLEVNMALGINSCTNPSGVCTVVSVQRVVNAVLGGSCVSP
jgi:hypothetical protein